MLIAADRHTQRGKEQKLCAPLHGPARAENEWESERVEQVDEATRATSTARGRVRRGAGCVEVSIEAVVGEVILLASSCVDEESWLRKRAVLSRGGWSAEAAQTYTDAKQSSARTKGFLVQR